MWKIIGCMYAALLWTSPAWTAVRSHELGSYDALVLDVYDGDTFTVMVDLGMDIHRKTKIRLYGVDTPELRTPEGPKVRDAVSKKILARTVTIIDYGDDKFGGRRLCRVLIDGQDLSKWLISKGYAKPYFGGKKDTNP